ncbi:helix-turn-helix transcriptional regulator [Salinisphaera sp. G21_0]|uniref:helix-turn-helix domain-containing protein n=1 Tax=Salinisphaera sp. G21_0 TaxID=2821094 RepID=UPI001ADA0394|nr:helix-turn-helix transcriptional regulator [Salinisphaera sp. G21_0]MBO9484336.1 helix-turn-helix transcriptional regulator [Salinisphaera sp. G21_0]
MNNSIIDKVTPKLKQPFESVGFLIYTMRENYGWNQTELAAKVGCTPACVSAWESGRMLPQSKNVLRLAGVFEMTPAEILMGMSCIVPAETETPEQAELTNSALREVMELEPGKPHHGLPESDQEAEERIGAYKGDDKPVFSLIFTGSELAHVRIAHRCKTIDVSPSDFPGLAIDAIAEVVRGE